MPIDPNIILGVKPVQIQQQDPIEQFGKSLTLKNLLLQNQQGEQAVQDDTAVREAYKTAGGDSARLRSLLSGGGQYKAVQALDKFSLDTEEKRTNIDKGKQEILTKAVANHRDALANVDTPQAAAQWVASAYQDPVLAPIVSKVGTIEQAMAKIPQDPQAFLKWKQESALGATKFIELNKPHVSTQDLGGTSQLVSTPGLGGAPTVLSATPKTQTPDSVATQAQAERHFQAGQNAPQYMETDSGIVALPKKPVAGQPITGATVVGPDGQPLGKPLKSLPPAVNDAIIGNAQSLYTLDKAINLLKGKDVDSAKGDSAATGWKGYLPQAILNRIDATGVDTRAEISDIGSLKIHDRSGAAVTVSEAPRLMPFIPSATDPADVALRKLARLKEEAERMQQGLTETYSKEQGYKPNPVLAKSVVAVKKDDKAVPAPAPSQSDIDAELRRRGVIK